MALLSILSPWGAIVVVVKYIFILIFIYIVYGDLREIYG